MTSRRPRLADSVALDFDWIDEGKVVACRYPTSPELLAELRALGVGLIINLTERAHPAADLAQHGFRQLQLPVVDFAAPTPQQIDRAVSAISAAADAGEVVAVHCAAGLGRAGTIAACYLVQGGLTADEAITEVRRRRPGSVEAPEQERAVSAYALRMSRGDS